METLQSIIKVLGLNHTFFIYLVAFAVLAVIVSKHLISPYYQRFLERETQTSGKTTEAKQLQVENQQLQKEYEQYLIQYNTQFQTALNQEKLQATLLEQKKIEQSQKEAQQLIVQSKKSMHNTLLNLQQELKQKAPELSQALTVKITE